MRSPSVAVLEAVGKVFPGFEQSVTPPRKPKESPALTIEGKESVLASIARVRIDCQALIVAAERFWDQPVVAIQDSEVVVGL